MPPAIPRESKASWRNSSTSLLTMSNPSMRCTRKPWRSIANSRGVRSLPGDVSKGEGTPENWERGLLQGSERRFPRDRCFTMELAATGRATDEGAKAHEQHDDAFGQPDPRSRNSLYEGWPGQR